MVNLGRRLNKSITLEIISQIQIPAKKAINNIFILTFFSPASVVDRVVCISTSYSLIFLHQQGSEILTLKSILSNYNSNDTFMNDNAQCEFNFPISHHSLMSVAWVECQKKQRPKTYIWTNGKILLGNNMPSLESEFNLNNFGSFFNLECQKQASGDQRSQSEVFKFDQEPVEVQQSQYFYFILDKIRLIIGSKITNQVIQYIPLQNV